MEFGLTLAVVRQLAGEHGETGNFTFAETPGKPGSNLAKKIRQDFEIEFRGRLVQGIGEEGQALTGRRWKILFPA